MGGKWGTPTERFWRLAIQADGCWGWRNKLSLQGYAALYVGDNRNVRAHRFAYELLIGAIPLGHELDHLCRNRGCVNPAHLEPVPHHINVWRGQAPAAVNVRKDQCVNGHPFDATNTATRIERGRERRRCRACEYESGRRAWERHVLKRSLRPEPVQATLPLGVAS